MKGLIGKKVGMTQIFDESGVVQPVTLISTQQLKRSVMPSRHSKSRQPH